MDNDNIYTEYNDERNRIPWIRIIIIGLIVVLGIFLVLILIKNCNKPSLRLDLVEAAKGYYDKFPTGLPKEVGECNVLNLSTLESEGLIDSKDYSSCDKSTTYVNVCYLENLSINYAATLSCDVETTYYSIWKDGTLNDIVDGTDVRFKFVGEQNKLVVDGPEQIEVKYYYPSDTTDIEQVDRYYASSPSSDYTGSEGQTTGYKWYTESSVKSYWNNGEYSSTAPSGYVNKDSENKVTKISITKPGEASYRTIKDITLYRYRNVARPYKFICVVPGTSSKTSHSIISDTHCAISGKDNGFKQTEKAFYTCDGNTDVAFNTPCSNYTEWSTTACTSNVTKGIECESKTGYEYTDTLYKWYTNNKIRKYYPSGSSKASGENTYFVSAPVSGAIRDNSTANQVYKFYKTSLAENTNMVEKWVEVTNGYVDLNELITTFNGLGYEVNSLSDIKAISDIRYQLKMQYRNVEE